MGFNEICNTGLVLGLGLSSTDENHKSKIPTLKFNCLGKTSEPSLALSLCGDPGYDRTVKKAVDITDQTGDLYRQDSTVSSLSNLSVKREREFGSEEGEIERVCSRVSDEDDDGGYNGRKKLRLTKAQSALLEENFKQNSTLNPKQKQELARELHLRPRQVEVWFQNRRARTKLKQTEVDCELLKKCCETLKEENRNLHKELQELKAQKLAQPFYMAATLSMCPSCERIGGGGGTGAAGSEIPAKSPFSMAPRSHFFNPFANPPPATC